MSRSVALCLFVSLAIGTMPRAFAQDTDAAQHDFAAATSAFDHGRYEEALRLFRSAFDAAPRAAVRFNVAVCLERLGRLREAWLEYRAAVAPGELSSEQLARAQSEAERLHALLATVDVRGSPTGADVRVDGVSVCSLPCSVEIDPGPHTVSAHANGASVERGIRVDRGQRMELEIDAVEPLSGAAASARGTGNAIAPVGAREDAGAREEPSARRGISWLTWVGVAVAAVGAGGVVGLGLRTAELHDEWLAGGPESVRDEGLTTRAVTNVSLGVALLGAALLAIDLVLALGDASPEARAAASGDLHF